MLSVDPNDAGHNDATEYCHLQRVGLVSWTHSYGLAEPAKQRADHHYFDDPAGSFPGAFTGHSIFTAQENTVLTKLSSIIMVIGVTLAVALAILLLKFTIDFPLLRILGACSIAFCGMYFMRISKLGSLGYMVALIVIYGQSFPDINSDPEIISRLLLWSWVAVVYPIVITIIVNFCCCQPSLYAC